MKTILTYIAAFMVNCNPVFASLTLGSVSMVAVFTWVNQQWTAMLAYIDALTASSFGGVLSFEPLALLNTFMPLSEGLSYLAAWLVILGVCTVIRIIKSFVPTVAT